MSRPHEPAEGRRLEALAEAAQQLSVKAYDSVERIVSERIAAGAPLTNEEALDLTLQLIKYRTRQQTKLEPAEREELRELMERLRRVPEPETEAP